MEGVPVWQLIGQQKRKRVKVLAPPRAGEVILTRP
jgi:L-alanine-DL-glutamate epimerase-like enolase superfamily enzyme